MVNPYLVADNTPRGARSRGTRGWIHSVGESIRGFS